MGVEQQLGRRPPRRHQGREARHRPRLVPEQHRMRNARFRALGMFVGSGAVEARCRAVIGQRLECRACTGRPQGATHSTSLSASQQLPDETSAKGAVEARGARPERSNAQQPRRRSRARERSGITSCWRAEVGVTDLRPWLVTRIRTVEPRAVLIRTSVRPHR